MLKCQIMTSEDSSQMDRKEYMEERRLLANLEADSYKSFDKALLTFSSGAIALSVTFLEKFDISCGTSLLILSWTLWLFSILFQLISYFVSGKAMREELAILNEQYKDYKSEPRLNKWTGWPSRLNLAALGAFLLGTFIFLVFISKNF